MIICLRIFLKKEIKSLLIELERKIKLISEEPTTYRKLEFHNVRKVVIKKFNTMYYRIHENKVEILSFFSNRQNPNRLKNILNN